MQKNSRLLLGSMLSGTELSPEEDNESSPLTPEWAIEIPEHVCVLEKLHMWIPLDRAVFVTRAVLHFLSEKYMTIILKHIESMAMFLSSQGILEEPDGNHTVIRAAMRRFQEMTTESVLGQATTSDSKTMVVNMEKLLQA
jgi:hypothetical protein